MSNAFASILQARPSPAFGRPVHLRGSPLDYGPVLLLMPFEFHLAMDTLPSGVPLSGGFRSVLICFRLSPLCPTHSDIQAHRKNAHDSDQPFAAVIKDLKSRGLLKDTLVVCGSEFGRTPVMEIGAGAGGSQNGRDHNPFGFTMWLAGGGIKGGTIYGATDEFGFKAVEKPVHVHDLHATILHLMGIDHTKLTYRFSGRDFRLTDVSGNVITDIIA